MKTTDSSPCKQLSTGTIQEHTEWCQLILGKIYQIHRCQGMFQI